MSQRSLCHIDFKMVEILQKLKEGKNVEVPIYDFNTHSRCAETKTVYGATIIIFEGIMTFHAEKLRELMDLKSNTCASFSTYLY